MSEDKGFLAEELDSLHGVRDELRDGWQELEHRWHQLEGRMKVVREGLREDGQDVREAARLLVSELREGYEHLRERL